MQKFSAKNGECMQEESFCMRPGEKPLVGTRGQLMDHFALSLTNLDAWIKTLSRVRVRFLEQPPQAWQPARCDD